MPRHTVQLRIPRQIEVQNTDIEVDVYSNDSKLGTLKISKGSIDWTPSGNHVNHVVMPWEDFADLMKSRLDRQ